MRHWLDEAGRVLAKNHTGVRLLGVQNSIVLEFSVRSQLRVESTHGPGSGAHRLGKTRVCGGRRELAQGSQPAGINTVLPCCGRNPVERRSQRGQIMGVRKSIAKIATRRNVEHPLRDLPADLSISEDTVSHIECAGIAPDNFSEKRHSRNVLIPGDPVKGHLGQSPAIGIETLPSEVKRAWQLRLLGAERGGIGVSGDQLQTEGAVRDLPLQIEQLIHAFNVFQRLDAGPVEQRLQLSEVHRICAAHKQTD